MSHGESKHDRNEGNEANNKFHKSFNMKNQKHNIESDEVQINPNKTPIKINSKRKAVAKATMYEYVWCDTAKI